MKDEPIPTFEHSPFAEGSFTPHPWIPAQDTFTPVADSNCPGGGLPAGDNPLGRSATLIEPNELINWKESE